MTALHVSRWPQSKILDYFWMMVRMQADKIDLLKQLAVVVVQRDPGWSPEAVREEHVHSRRKYHQTCFCCCTGDRRLYWHHVIAIANGGDNTQTNIVAICLRCHAAVHPWLDADAPGQRRRRRPHDMEPIHDIAARSYDTLAAVMEGRGK